MGNIDNKIDGAAVQQIEMLSRRSAPMTAAGAIAAGARSIQDDPQWRRCVDLRIVEQIRVLIDLGGTVNAANKIEIQYHPGGDMNVASADAGWATLCMSDYNLGGFLFAISQPQRVPNPARINNCIVRPVYFDGNGVANPVMRACALLFN